MQQWRLFAILWLAGLPGIAASAWLLLPRLIALQPEPPPLPAGILGLATALQGALLLALAVAVGVRLAPRVGLRAPVAEAWAAGRSGLPDLRRQGVPALVGGGLGGLLLLAWSRWAPPPLAMLRQRLAPPLPVRLLYGGITEELLLRWGVMTLVVALVAWLLGRSHARPGGTPSAWAVPAAIALSSLLFGLAHLPLATAVLGPLPLSLSATLVLVNGVFGVIAGVLYWRWGLEATVIGHALAHLLAFSLGA